MDLNKELNKAIQDKKIALSNFNNADAAFIDVAIYQYNAAAKKVDVIVQMIKNNSSIKEQIV